MGFIWSWVAIWILAGSLYVNYGHFHPIALWGPLVAAVLFVLSQGSRLGKGTLLFALFSAIAFLTLDMLTPLFRYANNKEGWILLKWMTAPAWACLVGVAVGVARKRPWVDTHGAQLFGIFAFLLGGAFVWIVRASPEPYIDVWVVTKEAVTGLLSGQNPYSIGYTHIYRPEEVPYESFFGYPPLAILYSIPFTLLGDPRLGWILALVLAGVALFQFAAKAEQPMAYRFALAAAFLTFPVNPFILEQSWIDPLGLLFLFVSARALQEKRFLLVGLSWGLFFSLKQSYFLAFPLLFGWTLLNERAQWVRIWSVVGGILLFIHLPFVLWNPTAFFDRVLWFLADAKLKGGEGIHLFVRKDALSLVAWALHKGWDFPRGLGWLTAGGVTVWALWSRWSLFLSLGMVFLVFFPFGNWAFCNYYWFALGPFWIWMAEKKGLKNS